MTLWLTKDRVAQKNLFFKKLCAFDKSFIRVTLIQLKYRFTSSLSVLQGENKKKQRHVGLTQDTCFELFFSTLEDLLYKENVPSSECSTVTPKFFGWQMDSKLAPELVIHIPGNNKEDMISQENGNPQNAILHFLLGYRNGRLDLLKLKLLTSLRGAANFRDFHGKGTRKWNED
nr:hypothetical protein Iba_chr13dCG10560 [Ipomoea batatas]